MFVIAGIIILIVSFVVALISLIREQEQEPHEEVTKPPMNPQQHLGRGEVAHRALNQEPSTQVITSPPDLNQEPLNREFQPEQPVQERAAFLWEDQHAKVGQPIQEKSIEEIRAELARIAGEKAGEAGQEPGNVQEEEQVPFKPVVHESPMSPAPNNTWAPEPKRNSTQQGEVWVNPNR